MKHSTPTSSNVSPSTSSNTPMCSSKTTTSGCFTAIIRKLLCSENLPKDPSYQIQELSRKDHNFNTSDENDVASVTVIVTPPPLVARLMGLESMADTHFGSKGSLSRSKSMNSLDYLGENDGKIMSVLHKRVNSTLSFREPPCFSLTENENFFVFSFEKEGENSESLRFNGRKNQMGCSELLKKKVETERVELKEKNKRENIYVEKEKMSKRVSDSDKMSSGKVQNRCNELREITNNMHQVKGLCEKKCFDSEAVEMLKPMKYKEAVICEKMKKRRRRKKTIESECVKSDDSSPDSVLEFERKSCGTGGLSSRRKLTPELENNKLIPRRSDDNLMIDEKKEETIETNKKEGSKKVKNMKEYIEIWSETCKLVEDELVGSNQIHAWMNEQSDLRSLCADFESEIFYQLLNEVVTQLLE